MDYITTVEMSKNGGFHQEEFPFCVVRAECLVQRKRENMAVTKGCGKAD